MNQARTTQKLPADTFDAIVVGARVSGAATAALLAERGARVLLLDQATFPAPTVSCPIIFGNSLAVLERIGALASVEALGAPKIRLYGTRLQAIDLTARLPATLGRDYAYSIRRERLDEAVLRQVACRPGITLRENFKVTGLIWSLGRVVGVRGRPGHGPEQVFYADLIVGADGKRSLVAREVGAQIYARMAGESCIFYAYYRDFAPLREPSAIAYVDPSSRTGVLVFDADAGLTVVSAGLPAEQFAAAKRDPEEAIERVWRGFPELAERGRHAARATKVMGQGPLDSYFRQSYGPGWALVGDAGHYLDPVTGQGINNALRSAELLAEAWAQRDRRAGWQGALAEYQRQRDAAARPMFDLMAASTRLRALAEARIGVDAPLLRAIARSPAHASRYVGIYSGATPIAEFFNPANLGRILLEDQWLSLFNRIDRGMNFMSAQRGSARAS